MVLTSAEKSKMRNERFRGMKQILIKIMNVLEQNDLFLPVSLDEEEKDVFNWVKGEMYTYNSMENLRIQQEKSKQQERQRQIEYYGL